MANINYEAHWNQEDLERFLTLTNKVFKRATELLAEDVWGNIGREAPTDHGRLAGSFSIEEQPDPAGAATSWLIYSNVEYALYVHEGTGIYGPTGHEIVPRFASCLVFEWQGRTWFLRSVRGQEANPYADRAIQTSSARTDEFVRLAISETEAVA